MFTGIIEELGTVGQFSQYGENAKITVECSGVLEGVKIGDSIAINGVCQTVISFDKKSFSAEISSETISVTNLSSLKSGSVVNLERAITLNTRLGGHIVSGHVDGIGKINKIQKNNGFYNLTVSYQKDLEKYIAKKGSVTVNGVSLTVADTNSESFELAIIPHTFENTNLKTLKIGDFVNIEVDILARYIEKILSTSNNSCKNVLNENFLKENGFF